MHPHPERPFWSCARSAVQEPKTHTPTGPAHNIFPTRRLCGSVDKLGGTVCGKCRRAAATASFEFISVHPKDRICKPCTLESLLTHLIRLTLDLLNLIATTWLNSTLICAGLPVDCGIPVLTKCEVGVQAGNHYQATDEKKSRNLLLKITKRGEFPPSCWTFED